MATFAVSTTAGGGTAYARAGSMPGTIDWDSDIRKAALFASTALAALWLVGRAPTFYAAVSDVSALATLPAPAVADHVANGFQGFLTNELSYGARTATVTGAPKTPATNPAFLPRGVVLTVDLTAFVTAASLTPAIQLLDPATGNFFDVLGASAITATGTYTFVWHPTPGAAGAAVTRAVLGYNAPLGIWRLVFTHGNSNSHTYGAAFAYVA